MGWSEWKSFGGDFEIIDMQCKVANGNTQTINISHTSNGEKLIFTETSYGLNDVYKNPTLNGASLTYTSQQTATSVQYSKTYLRVYEIETKVGDVFNYSNSFKSDTTSAGARQMVSVSLFKC